MVCSRADGRFESDMSRNTDTRAIGAFTAMTNLKDLAAHRSDVFGLPDKETAIGMKVNYIFLVSLALCVARSSSGWSAH